MTDGTAPAAPETTPYWPIIIPLAFLLIGTRWIWLYRHGHVLDIDETGYLSDALGNYFRLQASGILGWMTEVWRQTSQAPVTAALATLVFALVGAHPTAGLAIPLIAGTLSVALAYFLGREVAGAAVGVWASILTATCPVIVNYSRTFVFALPAAAVCAAALLALLKSRRFEDWRWSLAFGILMGLLPLTRTMTIAFLPPMILAALVYALPLTARRFKLLAMSFGSAIVVAASWLIPNGKYVFSYLFDMGYGGGSKRFSAVSGLLPIAGRLWQNADLAFFLPHTVLLLAGFLCWVIAVGAMRPTREQVIDAIRSPTAVLSIFALGGYAALASSSNMGTGFAAPLVPALLVVAVQGLSKIARQLAALAALAISLIAGIPTLDLSLAQRTYLAGHPLTGGMSHIFDYLTAAGYSNPGAPLYPLYPEQEGAWNATIADLAHRLQATRPPIAFGSLGYIVNVNSVGLEWMLLTKSRMRGMYLPGNLLPGQYIDWLSKGGASAACTLVTTGGTRGDIFKVETNTLEWTAILAGFAVADSLVDPSGRQITIWRRSRRGC